MGRSLSRAALTGRLSFDGDTKLALEIQRIQEDLIRLYSLSRQAVTGRQA